MLNPLLHLAAFRVTIRAATRRPNETAAKRFRCAAVIKLLAADRMRHSPIHPHADSARLL